MKNGAMPDCEKRSRMVTVRVRQDEYDELARHAEAAGISTSQLVRLRVLGLDEPKAKTPDANHRAWHDLRGIGTNLNQLVHHLNVEAKAMGRAALDLIRIKVEIGELQRVVAELKRAVLDVR